MKTLRLFSMLLVMGAIAVGCASPANNTEKALYDTKEVAGPPIQTTQVITNTAVDQVTGSVVTTYTTNTVQVPGHIIQILIPRPAVTEGLSWAKDLPIPYAGPIAGILGFLYGGYANIRNKKISGTLVDNIEILGDKLFAANPTLYDQTIQQVQDHQVAMGTREAILPLVAART